MLKRSALITVLVACGCAAPALAARNATPDEKAAILQGVVVTTSPECFDVTVSTVDATWAEAIAPNALCSGDYFYALAHQTAAGWEQQPLDPESPFCPIGNVPTPVALDLKLCRKPGKVYIPRLDRLAFRPKSLPQGAHGAFVRLRWHRWGKPVAKATGTLAYSDAYASFRVPVRLRASGISSCGDPGKERRTYVSLRMAFVHKSDRTRHRALSGEQGISCP